MAKWLKLYAIYILHLTWPTSLHYLVKGGCSKFLPNTGFVTVRLLRFSVKMKTAYCRDNFLARRLLPDIRRLSGFFYVSTGRHPGASACDTGALVERERDASNASEQRVVVYARHISSTNSDNFEQSVMTTNNSNK